MAERDKPREDTPPADETDGDRANKAPDAVKDPSEKTDGKPGLPPGGGGNDDEADPGSG